MFERRGCFLMYRRGKPGRRAVISRHAAMRDCLRPVSAHPFALNADTCRARVWCGTCKCFTVHDRDPINIKNHQSPARSAKGFIVM
ncbi:unnamed protein product, partial [Iphiclides podalirius]